MTHARNNVTIKVLRVKRRGPVKRIGRLFVRLGREGPAHTNKKGGGANGR